MERTQETTKGILTGLLACHVGGQVYLGVMSKLQYMEWDGQSYPQEIDLEDAIELIYRRVQQPDGRLQIQVVPGPVIPLGQPGTICVRPTVVIDCSREQDVIATYESATGRRKILVPGLMGQ